MGVEDAPAADAPTRNKHSVALGRASGRVGVEGAPAASAPASAVFPDAEYLVLSSRLIPGLDGGYTIATLSRAQQMAAAGVADGRGPQLLTFDPGTADAHAEHRDAFAQRGALADVTRMRNLFDEGVAPGGGAADWLLAAAEHDAPARTDREYRVLVDAERRPFVALPVLPGNPDWHLTDESVLVYDAAGDVVGGLRGFRGLYLAWLDRVVSGLGDGPVVVICESRQIGELIAGWTDPRVRIIHTVHTIHLEPPFTPDAPLNPLWTRWFALADRFDAVVWPTQTQRDDVVARFGDGSRHRVVPNGTDAPVGIRPAARESGLVVALARLAPGKRLDHTIRAFAHADVSGARLEIWGDGSLREQLQGLITELGLEDRVALMGHTSHAAGVLDRATLLISSTAFEGQGLSVVEALAHGCPVVSYDVRYGPADILASDGGILVPDGDETALADAVSRVLTDEVLRARLMEEAPSVAESWSSAHAMAALADAVRFAMDAERNPGR